jgi:primosomal protein N' (replication factor Y)
VEAAPTHDFLSLYEAMKVERSEARYPPFVRLVNILMTGAEAGPLRVASETVGDLLRDCPQAELLGPTDCAIERLQGKWRRHMVLKLPADASAAFVGERLKDATFPGIQLLIDVDPQSLI